MMSHTGGWWAVVGVALLVSLAGCGGIAGETSSPERASPATDTATPTETPVPTGVPTATPTPTPGRTTTPTVPSPTETAPNLTLTESEDTKERTLSIENDGDRPRNIRLVVQREGAVVTNRTLAVAPNETAEYVAERPGNYTTLLRVAGDRSGSEFYIHDDCVGGSTAYYEVAGSGIVHEHTVTTSNYCGPVPGQDTPERTHAVTLRNRGTETRNVSLTVAYEGRTVEDVRYRVAPDETVQAYRTERLGEFRVSVSDGEFRAGATLTLEADCDEPTRAEYRLNATGIHRELSGQGRFC